MNIQTNKYYIDAYFLVMGFLVLSLSLFIFFSESNLFALIGLPVSALIFYFSKKDISAAVDSGFYPKTLPLRIAFGMPSQFIKQYNEFDVLISQNMSPIIGTKMNALSENGVLVNVISKKTMLVSFLQNDLFTDIRSMGDGFSAVLLKPYTLNCFDDISDLLQNLDDVLSQDSQTKREELGLFKKFFMEGDSISSNSGKGIGLSLANGVIKKISKDGVDIEDNGTLKHYKSEDLLFES